MNSGEWIGNNGRKYRWRIYETAGRKHFDSEAWNGEDVEPHWYSASIPVEDMEDSLVALNRLLKEQEVKQPKLMGLVEAGKIELIEKRLDNMDKRLNEALASIRPDASKTVDLIVALPMTPKSSWLNTKFRLILGNKPVLEWKNSGPEHTWEPVPNEGLFLAAQVNAVVEAAYYAGISKRHKK